MSGKGLKRLDLWLPENHPIFSYPPRTRAKTARDWLDIGARLSGLEKKLEDLEAKLASGAFPTGQEQEKIEELPFDPAEFGKSLTDMFG